MIANSFGYRLNSNRSCWIRDLFGEPDVVDITEQYMWSGNTTNAYSVVQVVAHPEGNGLIVETCAFMYRGLDNKGSQSFSATGPTCHQFAVTYDDFGLSEAPYLAHILLISLQNVILGLKNETLGLPASTVSHYYCGGMPTEKLGEIGNEVDVTGWRNDYGTRVCIVARRDAGDVVARVKTHDTSAVRASSRAARNQGTCGVRANAHRADLLVGYWRLRWINNLAIAAICGGDLDPDCCNMATPRTLGV